MRHLVFFLLFFPVAALAQVNLQSGLAAYYPFNGNANDESGNSNNASFINATLTADRFGKPKSAYFFNGVDNYIRIPNSRSINMRNKISISAWVKIDGFYKGTCHGNTIVMKGDADYLQGNYMLRFEDHAYTGGKNCNNRVPDTQHQNFHGANAMPAYGGYTPFIRSGQWYNVVYTCDGVTANLYVNCELKVSGPADGMVFTNKYDLFLSKMNHSQYPYWFHGVMDEVRIYNRALAEKEILALCNKNNVKETPADPCAGTNSISAKFNYRVTGCRTASFDLDMAGPKKISRVQWFFGDGTTSDKFSSEHTYKKYGKYKVKAIAISKEGCVDTFTKRSNIRGTKN